MHKFLLIAGFLAFAMFATAQEKPYAPANLQAKVSGLTVDLSWDDARLGATKSSYGFETPFAEAGWSVKTTNTRDPHFTWFQFPTDQYTSTDNWQDYIFAGEHSAYVNFDMYRGSEENSAHQDEWLISPEIKGVSYLSFEFFINPILLENGADEAFPNDYYVKVSRDGGETWENVWNARYDMLPVEAYQKAIVYIGEPEETLKVAFVAHSDPAQTLHGLYFSWALDEIEFHEPSAGAQTIASYNVYLDDQLLKKGVYGSQWSDVKTKTYGNRQYSVTAVNAAGVESEPVSVAAEVVKPDFKAPTNFKVTSSYDEDSDTYSLQSTFDFVSGDFLPEFYIVAVDGTGYAWIQSEDQLPFELTGVSPGTYKLEVYASYFDPEGESEHVEEWITVGCRSIVRNLNSEVEGNDVKLTWDAPTDPDAAELKAVIIARDGEEIASVESGLSYADNAAPDGVHRYNVVCEYNDGTKSPVVFVDVKVGAPVKYKLPHTEDFNRGDKPVDWQIGSMENMTPVVNQFCFDNKTGLEIEGEGFDGGFASSDSDAAGFTQIANYLVTPVYDLSDIEDRSGLTMSFYYDFRVYYDSSVTMDYSTDCGETWQPVDGFEDIESYTDTDLEEGQTCKPMYFERIMEDECEGAESIMFRFLYFAAMEYHFAIDNWKFYDANSSSVSSVAGDSNLRVNVTGDNLVVASSEPVECIEVYDAQGRMLNRAEASQITLPAKGLSIVKVTTAAGTTVCKVVR